MKQTMRCQHGITLQVHVYGELEIVEDEQALIDSLQNLAHTYEDPQSITHLMM